ncbi:hypothetical protein QWM81_17555 [Streptomyces ficellus]|uniref:Uncharacterized protein n=1 Tax=Streptomyces ficellus TaxID=1977088 RepID=A0ABT7Z8R7_9ACTN|nr:hypothetical protein [Streptomyces ficellus]MDN3295823.1 hypothetical protein [Streptomyces ficellus]
MGRDRGVVVLNVLDGFDVLVMAFTGKVCVSRAACPRLVLDL